MVDADHNQLGKPPSAPGGSTTDPFKHTTTMDRALNSFIITCFYSICSEYTPTTPVVIVTTDKSLLASQ